MSRYIRSPRFGIRCYPGTWWLGKRFEAITLFGTIHFNCSRADLEHKLQTPALLRTERHEHIHMLQARTFRTRYLGFYLTYVGFWLRNIVRYGFRMKAYFEIPFEREAYANEHREVYAESHWRDYRQK